MYQKCWVWVQRLFVFCVALLLVDMLYSYFANTDTFMNLNRSLEETTNEDFNVAAWKSIQQERKLTYEKERNL